MFNFSKKRWIKQLAGLGQDSFVYNPFVISNPQRIVIGNHVKILDNARIQAYSEDVDEVSVQIDDGCYIGYNFSLLARDKIHIEKHVLIASNVLITSHNHGINPEIEYYMDQPLSGGGVVIGEGSWIGEKVCILAGVTIGKKCVIGAGSVVTKSIPDYCIAGGNPAEVIKKYDFELHAWKRINED